MTTPAWPSVHSQPLCWLCSLSLNPEASSGRVRQPKGQHTGSEIRRADDQTDDAGRESSQFPSDYLLDEYSTASTRWGMLLYYREIQDKPIDGIDATTDVANLQLVLIAAG
ncbi:hypothetical protein HDV62DRAFT_384204 [Trichoderma sp. SZMC 28011]